MPALSFRPINGQTRTFAATVSAHYPMPRTWTDRQIESLFRVIENPASNQEQIIAANREINVIRRLPKRKNGPRVKPSSSQSTSVLGSK